MRATSTNVANVNTVGYSRLDVQFISKQAQGGMHGVEVEITRIANAYLAAAEMRGAADVASADILSQIMDRAQGLLGRQPPVLTREERLLRLGPQSQYAQK